MHKTMRSLFILFIVVGSTLMVACGSSVPVVKPFKMDIQQGNVVTSKMLLQLRPGMTKSQVRFIMGTPLINDSFHTNRWDYFYQMRRAGKVIEQRRVILDFENELLARVRGDVVPQGTPGADTGVTLSNEPGATAKPVAKEGLLENLKFWKSNQEPVVEPATKAPATKPTDIKPQASEKAAPAEAAKPVVPEPEAADAAPTAEPEAPSMLAVPIEIAPVEAAPAPTVLPAPTAAPPAAEPVKEPVVSPAPAKQAPTPAPAPAPAPTPAPATPTAPPPAPANPDEQFIFRLDKDLDAESLQNPQAAPVESGSKPKAADEKAVPAEDPGYFERMLEKIGF